MKNLTKIKEWKGLTDDEQYINVNYELDMEPGHLTRLVDAYNIKGDVVGFLTNLFKDLYIQRVGS